MHTLLSEAIQIAERAHRGQIDKAGEPYLFHPMRVAWQFVGNPKLQLIALLHDTVEDTFNQQDPVTERLLAERFGLDIALQVGALTRRKQGMEVLLPDGATLVAKQDEDYFAQYIPRMLEDAVARRIKRQDILDNLLSSRIRGCQAALERRGIEPKAARSIVDVRQKRYQHALALIEYAERKKPSAPSGI